MRSIHGCVASVCVLVSLLVAASPAEAQFNLGGNAQKYLRDQLSKALGEQAPLVLNPNEAFVQVPLEQAPNPRAFRPIALKTVADFNRPLPPGDYSFTAMFYCTQWSVHRPGRGHPYTIGRAQGRLAKQISALLYEGTMSGFSPAVLNGIAWRIEGSVPLGRWSDPEKALVHDIIPQYEEDLKGDWLQRIEDGYNKSFRLVTRKSFNDELSTMGDLGQLALQLKAAHEMLMDTTVVPERLPDLMFQRFGGGGMAQLADDPGHPSPWMRVSNGVMARFTVYDGNLGANLMELRIGPEASNSSGRRDAGLTVAQIVNAAGSADEDGIIGYSPDSQSPIIEPIAVNDGRVDICLRATYGEQNNLWFQGGVFGEHNYTAINSIGKFPFEVTSQDALRLLEDRIETMFPDGGAHGMDGPQVLPNRKFTVGLNLPGRSNVICTEASPNAFTFVVIPAQHELNGYVKFGVFKDSCNELWLYQYGKWQSESGGGSSDNPSTALFNATTARNTWAAMAGNLRQAILQLHPGANPNGFLSPPVATSPKLTPAQANAQLIALWTNADGSPSLDKAKTMSADDVSAAIKAGANPDTTDTAKFTALIAAACADRADVAKVVLDAHANVDYLNPSFGTALIQAAVYGSVDVVKLLLDHHANVNLADSTGATALSQANAPQDGKSADQIAQIVKMLKAAGETK